MAKGGIWREAKSPQYKHVSAAYGAAMADIPHTLPMTIVKNL